MCLNSPRNVDIRIKQVLNSPRDVDIRIKTISIVKRQRVFIVLEM